MQTYNFKDFLHRYTNADRVELFEILNDFPLITDGYGLLVEQLEEH